MKNIVQKIKNVVKKEKKLGTKITSIPSKPVWVDDILWNSLDDKGKINLINGKR